MCKNSLISNFWNSQSPAVAFSAGVLQSLAGIRRRNFFSGGRRKNAVFSPREKSEFPLQECSVNLHYKIGGQIWSGNPAENRPPPRPPAADSEADDRVQNQAVFAQAPWNFKADGGGSGPRGIFRSPPVSAWPRGPPVCQNARQRPVRDVPSPRTFSALPLKFCVNFQAARSKLPTVCSRLYREVPPQLSSKSGGDRRFPAEFCSLAEAFFRPKLCWAP